MFEKSKIRSYLRKVDKNKNAFDYLLLDYLSGKLKREFKSEKIRVISIRTNCSDNDKCIRVHGKYQAYRVDVEIYPDKFVISYDSCNHDRMTYPLSSSDQVYNTLINVIKVLHSKYS